MKKFLYVYSVVFGLAFFGSLVLRADDAPTFCSGHGGDGFCEAGVDYQNGSYGGCYFGGGAVNWCDACGCESIYCSDGENHNSMWNDILLPCNCSHVVDGVDCPTCTGVFVHAPEPPLDNGGGSNAPPSDVTLGLVETVKSTISDVIGLILFAGVVIFALLQMYGMLRNAYYWICDYFADANNPDNYEK